jgi:peptide methionine sulfoxide reductase MsrB
VGEYTNHDEPGVYDCVGCGAPLFSSDTKFHSGTQPIPLTLTLALALTH